MLYTAKPHGAAMTAMPLSPTPDRAGRTVRIDAGAHTTLVSGRIPDKKHWINLVGPMAAAVVLPADFTGTTGIYSRTTTADGGAHVMLVVGFDDFQGCWILKNSWGSAWGDQGFIRVAFGQAWLEDAAWTGVRNTNPDPWTKRRRRNGVILESGNGSAHMDREVFLRSGMNIDQFWQEPGAGLWNRAGVVESVDPWRGFGPDVLDCPAVVQSTFNRNYELVYRSTMGAMRHVFFDQASGWWFDGTLFGPSDPLGIPGFVQGNRGAPGDFEVVVLTKSGSLEHWTKHNGSPWTNPPGTWYRRAVIAASGITASGPALVSSRRNISGELEQETGELHFVAPASNELRHYCRLPATGAWSQVAAFGNANAKYSGPCMMETLDPLGDELTAGPFELFVETGNRIEHWILLAPSPYQPFTTWNQVTTFGDNVLRVVGVLQGSNDNLVVIAQLTEGSYQQYERIGINWVAVGLPIAP